MPQKIIRFALSALMISAASLYAAEETGESPAVAVPEKEKPEAATKFRSRSYDASSIEALYKEAKAKNEERAKLMPEHLNTDGLDYVELKTFRVDGSNIEFQRKLVDALEPRPRRRLSRIANFDPEEANLMIADVRGDQAFLDGTYDAGRPSGSGRAATFDQRQLQKGLNDAIEVVRKAMGSKTSSKEKASDTQR